MKKLLKDATKNDNFLKVMKIIQGKIKITRFICREQKWLNKN